MLVNRETILVKTESTYNTDPALIASDAVNFQNSSVAFEGLRMIDQSNLKSNLSTDKSIFGGTLRKLTFDVPMRGSGAAGTAPEIDALLKACGFSATISAGVSVTYALASVSISSCYIKYYSDGLLYALGGCRGNVSFSIGAGNVPMASFEMTGHSVKPTDVILLAGSFDSTVPAAVYNIPFSIGGYSAVIQQLVLSTNNEIATPEDISSSSGYGEVRISKRDVAGSMNPEATLVTARDWEGLLRAGTPGALAIGPIGVTGSIINISCPAVYYRDITQGDRSSIRVLDIPFGCDDVSGDDEISIVFT